VRFALEEFLDPPIYRVNPKPMFLRAHNYSGDQITVVRDILKNLNLIKEVEREIVVKEEG
jgi:hypothetical protein